MLVLSACARYQDDVSKNSVPRRSVIRLCYSVLLYANFLIVSYGSTFLTSQYNSMKYHFNVLNEHFDSYQKYQLRMKKINRIVCILYPCVCAGLVCSGVSYFIIFDPCPATKQLLNYLNEFFLIFVHLRFFIELTVPIVWMCVVIEFLKIVQIIASEEHDKNQVRNVKTQAIDGTRKPDFWCDSFIKSKQPKEQINKKFHKLHEIQYHIQEGCILFKELFGLQIFFALGTIVYLLVVVCYWCATTIIFKAEPTSGIYIIVSAATYLLPLIGLSLYGQGINNLLKSIILTLVRIKLKLISEKIPSEYVCGAARVWRELQGGWTCFAGAPLDMRLLPSVVSLIVTYTILVLQLDHLI